MRTTFMGMKIQALINFIYCRSYHHFRMFAQKALFCQKLSSKILQHFITINLLENSTTRFVIISNETNIQNINVKNKHSWKFSTVTLQRSVMNLIQPWYFLSKRRSNIDTFIFQERLLIERLGLKCYLNEYYLLSSFNY